MYSSVGQNLRRLREEAGWSQSELSRRSGVTVATISRIEAGKIADPQSGKLRALALALATKLAGVTIDDLMDPDLPLVQPDDPELLRRIEEQHDWLDELSPETQRIAISNMMQGIENRRRRELRERRERQVDPVPVTAAG